MIKLYPFQVEGAVAGAKRNLLINYDCGLGKTVTAIEIANHVVKSFPPREDDGGILVVVPKRLRLQWVYMIHEQYPDAEIQILEYGIPFKLHVTPPTWTITHYEALVSQKLRFAKRLWAAVIVDEAHWIKNRKAQRTKAVFKLDAFRKIALTATPMERSPGDVWSILHWINPWKYHSYWDFVKKFCAYEQVPTWYTKGKTVLTITGAKNPDGLAELTKDDWIRKEKWQVASDLPERTETTVHLELEPKQREAYVEMRNADDIVAMVDNVEIFIPSAIAMITRLQQMTSYPSMLGLEGVPSAKVAWVKEYLQDNPNEPIVLFTRFRATAEHLSELLECPLIIGGGDPEAINEFVLGDSRVIVGTIDAMGEGVDGLQKANTAIFVDCVWSATKMTQAIDRIHRLGINSPKQIIYLTHPDTVDDLVRKAIVNKWSDAELVFAWKEHYDRQSNSDSH